MSYQYYQYVLGLLSVSSLFITSTDAAVHFLRAPHSPLYVVKGETARLVWTYHVGNRNSEFRPISPEWFYMKNQIKHMIGGDNGFRNWNFQIITPSCPRRLLIPAIRVSRQGQATLVIQNTTMNDTGIYGCRLSLRSGSDKTSTVQLIATETPTFVVKLNAITAVVENSDLRLTCTAVGTPTPNVTWVHSVTKATITQGKGSAVLYLSKIKRNLNGNKYQCQAINNPNQGPVTIATTVVVYFLPGSPLVFVTDKESTSVTIRWTQPVYNGGSPIIAYRIVIDSKTFDLNDTSTMFYTVTDLSPNTQYVVNVSSRNLAGYSNSTSVTFTTRGQESSTCGQDGGAAGLAVSVTFLVISLIASILLVVYFYRTKRKTREPTDKGYDTKTVQMDSVTSSVTMAQSSHPSVITNRLSRPSRTNQPHQENQLLFQTIGPYQNNQRYMQMQYQTMISPAKTITNN